MDGLRQAAAVALVFGLLWALLHVMRKRGGQLRRVNSSGARDVVQLRGRLTLTAQHSVHCVRIGQREFVLGVHPSGITLLSEAQSESAPVSQQP